MRGRQLHLQKWLSHIADIAHSFLPSTCVAVGDGTDPDANLGKKRTYVKTQLKHVADLLSAEDAIARLRWRLPSGSAIASDEVASQCLSLDFPWRAEGDFAAGGKSEVQLYLAFSR